jgi:SEC-C motif
MARKPEPRRRTPVHKKERKPTLPQHNLPPHLAPLMELGQDEDPEYGMSLAEQVPEEHQMMLIDQLLEIARDTSFYTYGDIESADPDPRCFAPVQAVRALCYVAEGRHDIAHQVLSLYTTDDLMIIEELPVVFASIGTGAFDMLAATVLDENADSRLRDGAAEGLAAMCQVDDESYVKAISVIEHALCASDDPELNAYLITYLFDLGSVESAPIIEQAYAEERIDVDIVPYNEFLNVMSQLADEANEEEYDEGETDADDSVSEASTEETEEVRVPFVADAKVGRNDPCPCGSGKKFKKCCGEGK